MYKQIRGLVTLAMVACLCFIQVPAFAAMTDKAVLGDELWRVTEDGDLVPGTTNVYNIGSTSLYPATLYLGGVGKSEWGSVERSIHFGIAGLTLRDGTFSTSTDPSLEDANNLTSLVWADGETSHIKVSFRIPEDYASGGAFRAFVDTSGDGGAAATSLDWNYTKNRSGTAWDGTPTEETAHAIDMVQRLAGTPTTSTLTPTAAGWAPVAGDIVTISLWRTDDTASTSDLELYYLEFFYTATQ